MQNLVMLILGLLLTCSPGADGRMDTSAMQRALAELLGENTKISIKIPAPKTDKNGIATFNRITISINNWETDAGTLDSATIVFSNVRARLADKPRIIGVGKAEFTAELSQNSLLETAKLSGRPIEKLSFTGSRINASGAVDIGLGFPVDYTVTGKPSFDAGTLVIIKPETVSVFGIRFKRTLKSKASGFINPLLDFEGFDISYSEAEPHEKAVGREFRSKISSARVSGGKLKLHGKFVR